MRAEFGAIGDPRKIVAEAWDLDAVAAAYRDFIEEFARRGPRTPEAVFAAQTMLVHAVAQVPVPRSRPARRDAARRLAALARARLFGERHDAWAATAQDYFRSLEAVRRAA